MKVKLLDVVELVVDMPDRGLRVGALGTIVDVYEDPRLAYEVEFDDGAGYTIAIFAVEPDQVRLADITRIGREDL